MTREEAIRCLSVHSSTNGSGLCTDKQHYEAKQMAIEALEQEPCEDAISRQHFDERIRLAGGMVDEELSEEFKSGVLTVLEMLKTEPSVIPSRPTGHWIKQTEDNYDGDKYKCSCCGEIIRVKLVVGVSQYITCPICGAKMESEEQA